MVITAAHIQPIVALIAGILILIMPRFLNLVVAIYLIFIGLTASVCSRCFTCSAAKRFRGLRGTGKTWCKARNSPLSRMFCSHGQSRIED